MGKKKRSHPDVEEILARPWCYYCERDFEDLKLLISHQKAKHFKCDRCGRRLNTAGGLAVHLSQVHKETLEKVENALPNRGGLDIEIFGMEGVPDDIVAQHRSRIVQSYYEAQEERRAATGNPPPGQSGGQGPAKKIRIETAEEIKKRLAEHKAQRALQVSAGNAGGNSVPGATGLDKQAGHNPSPGAFASPFPPPQSYGQPGYPPQQYPPSYPPGSAPPGYPTSSLPSRPPGTGAPPQNLPQRPPHSGSGAASYPYPAGGAPGVPSTLDDLVSSAAHGGGDSIDEMIRKAEAGAKSQGDIAPPSATEAKGKKDKSVRMMVSGSEFSLEELMVQWRTGSGGVSAAA